MIGKVLGRRGRATREKGGGDVVMVILMRDVDLEGRKKSSLPRKVDQKNPSRLFLTSNLPLANEPPEGPSLCFSGGGNLGRYPKKEKLEIL